MRVNIFNKMLIAQHLIEHQDWEQKKINAMQPHNSGKSVIETILDDESCCQVYLN